MSRLQLFSLSLLLACHGFAASPGEDTAPWRLTDVLKLSGDKVDRDDSSVKNARLELEMLQALSKTRVELRPQINLLSFSNPLFLAASLGSSLSINRRTAPSPVNMELGRLAVVEAEIGHARARLGAQMEATRQFFALAEARDLVAQACKTWRDRSSGREKMETLIALRKMTKLDLIRLEQDTVALESACVEARAQSQTAALTLMRLAGKNIDVDQVAIATDDLVAISTPSQLPQVGELIESAFESREDLRIVADHISQLSGTNGKRRLEFDSVSVGYAYLKNAVKSGSGLSKQYLIGGNVGHLDGGFYLSLRDTGADKASFVFLQSRFNRLQQGLEDVKLMLRHEVETNSQRASLAAARLRIAHKRQALAKELHSLTAERESQGLQAESDEIWTRRESAHAKAEAARVELEWKRSVFTILALCTPDKVAGAARDKSGRIDAASADARKITALLEEDSQLPDKATALLTSNDKDNETALMAASEANSTRRSFTWHAPQYIAAAFHPKEDRRIPQPPTITPVSATIQDNLLQDELVIPTGREIAAPPPTAFVKNVSPISPVPDHAQYLPPRPLRKVVQSGTVGMRLLQIHRQMSVNVLVSIDDRGHVTSAVILDPHATGAPPLVRGWAVAAARQWTFEPARMRGKSVASIHTIEFQFRPEENQDR
jgi:outer membrane protein TolC